MNYNILTLPEFQKQAKKLSKKYPSLKTELSVLFDELEQDPTLGTYLGNDVYKIRLAIKSKGKGKSGGARVITYAKLDETNIIVLSIYSKGEKDTISDKEIKDLLKQT